MRDMRPQQHSYSGLLAALCLFVCTSCARPAPPSKPEPEREITRIALGSCLRQANLSPSLLTIMDANPDLFIFMGDNMYADAHNPEQLAEAYRTLGSRNDFRALRSRVPMLATWDDHDYGVNDSGAEYPLKATSKSFFLTFWGVPKTDERWQRAGIYHAQVFGPPGRRVQIILLDTRSFRDQLREMPNPPDRSGYYLPSLDPAAGILGEAQWRWLARQLEQPAEARILVSSIQVLPTEQPGEKWFNFPAERRRLLNLLSRSGANNLLIVSGDRHFAELSRLDGVTNYPLFELTSSPLNSASAEKRNVPNSLRVGEMLRADNFGLLEIDWNDSARIKPTIVNLPAPHSPAAR